MKFTRILVLSCLLCTAATAEWELGPNSAATADLSVTGVYDSNIRASADEISDYYMKLEPFLRVRSTGARISSDGAFGVHIKRYRDHTQNNSDDADLRWKWQALRSDAETTGAELDLGYFENSDAVEDVNNVVKSKNFYANGSGEVLIARNNLFSAGASYRDSKRNLGSDQTSSSERASYNFIGFTDGMKVGVEYLHQQNHTHDSQAGATLLDQTADTVAASLARPLYAELTGTLTWGYRWLNRGTREAQLGLTDISGQFVSLDLQGPFLPRQYFPKTTGSFHLAYEEAQAPGLNERSNRRLVGRVDVAWHARERTTVDVYASRTQDLSILDQTVVNTGGGLGVAQKIGDFLDARLDVRYLDANFVNLGRSDKRTEAELSGNYQMNRHWSAHAGYRFLHSDSDAVIANYDRHVVTGTFTYAF